MDETIEIHTESIPLSALLKLAGIVGSGGEAKLLIRDAHVRVNGEVETRPGAKIRPGDIVALEGDPDVTLTVVGS